MGSRTNGERAAWLQGWTYGYQEGIKLIEEFAHSIGGEVQTDEQLTRRATRDLRDLDRADAEDAVLAQRPR